MCYPMSKSKSLVAVLAIAALSTAGVRAQGPQRAPEPTPGATAQGPANVNVVNQPTVTVGNTALQPIPVKEPAREPLHLNYVVKITQPSALSDVGLYSIPAEKRLTIEHVSMICASDTMQEAFGVVVANGNALTYLPTHSFANESGSHSVGATPLTAHVDSGSVALYATRSKSIGNSNCFFTLTGYLTAVQ